jgi:hypothetical protein
MAAPTRNLFAALTGNAGATSYVPSLTTLATGAAVGDCICVFVAADGNPTLSLGGTSAADGWELVAQVADATNACKAAYFRFMVAVAGTVPALTISSTASEAFVAQGVRIRPAAASALVFIPATTSSGSSTNPDPPAIVNGSGAARDILYCTFWGGDNIVASTAAPTNYANHQSATISNAANGCAIGSADRTVNAVANAGSENPGTFTRATEQWAAITTAVYQVGVHSVVADSLTPAAPALGTPALTQTHVVAASALAPAAPVLGTPPLAQAHALTASALATAAPALGTPALAQGHALTATGLTTGAPALGQPALGIIVNFVANALATAAPVLGTPALTQRHALTASNLATGSPALGTPSLAQAHGVVANALATAAPVLDAPALAQGHAVAAIALTTAAPALDSPSLTQSHLVAANDLVTGSPALGTPALSSAGAGLEANDLVTGSPALGTPALSQRHALVANALATAAPALDSPALVIRVSLAATSLTAGPPALGSPSLTQTHLVAANDLAIGLPALGSPVLSQRHALVANDLTTDSPALGQPPLETSIWGVLPGNTATVGERSRIPLPGGPRFRGVLPSRHRDRIARPSP